MKKPTEKNDAQHNESRPLLSMTEFIARSLTQLSGISQRAQSQAAMFLRQAFSASVSVLRFELASSCLCSAMSKHAPAYAGQRTAFTTAKLPGEAQGRQGSQPAPTASYYDAGGNTTYSSRLP